MPLEVPDPHPETGGAAGDLLADGAEPDEPQLQAVEDEGVLPAQPVEGEEAFGGDLRLETPFPVGAGPDSVVPFHDAAGHRQEQSKRVIGDRDRAGMRNRKHRNPPAPGRPQAHRNRISSERDHERWFRTVQFPGSEGPFPGDQDIAVPGWPLRWRGARRRRESGARTRRAPGSRSGALRRGGVHKTPLPAAGGGWNLGTWVQSTTKIR